MKVKVEKRYLTIEKYRAKLKIKKYITNILKFVVTALHGVAECVGIICLAIFVFEINPDTGEHAFIQVWNTNVQRNGIISTLSLTLLLLIMGYLWEEALKDEL